MENTIKLFLNDHGAFSNALKFETVVFFVLILVIFTFFFRKTFAFVVILLVFAMFMSEIFVKTKTVQVTDFNKVTLRKLEDIQSKINQAIRTKLNTLDNSEKLDVAKRKILENSQMKNLYCDATIIHFLHSLLPLADYNPQLFITWLNGIDNILYIKSQIESYYAANMAYPDNIAEMFEISLTLKSNTINNAHDFIYSVPKLRKMYDYVDKTIERYSVLISLNIDQIHKYYLHAQRLTGINNNTKFVTYDTTKSYDRMSNHSVINTKNKNQLIPFYY
jgi:hypothetical protein